MTVLDSLLDADDPREAAEALVQSADRFIAALGLVVGKAIEGHPEAVRKYVQAWRALHEHLLESAREHEHDLVTKDDRGRFIVVDAKGHPAPWISEVVDQGALQAPFSHWVTRHGSGLGTALYLLSEFRRYLPDHHALVPDAPVDPYPEVGPSYPRFVRLAFFALTSGRPLESIALTFDLNDTELGGLFGVSRQAVQQWTDLVPVQRQDRVRAVHQIADILRANLKPDRIPAVVRTPAAAYNGRSLLEAIGDGNELGALAEIRRTFDWAATA